MRSHSQYLSLITATLLLSLTSPIQVPGTLLGISGAMAAKPTQDSEVEGDNLSVMSLPKFNEGKFQIASSPSIVEKEPSPGHCIGTKD